MSVIANENEEEKDESGVVTKTGTSTGSTGGGQVASGPAISRQQEGSGQAPNIQKYIQANQGAGQQLASGIQEKAQQQAQTIQRGVDTSRTAFDQQAGNLQSKLGEQGQQSTQMAFKDPQALLQDQQRLDEFKRLQSQGYNQDIQASQQDLSELQSQQQQLASAGQMAGTEEGRFGLLQQTYGQPSYSMGQQRLDQLLFQTAPNASRSLQYDIGNLAQQEGSRISEFGDQQQAKLDALMGLSQDRATEIKNMLQFGTDAEGLEEDLSGRGLRDIQTDLEARLTNIQQTAPEQVAGLRERLAANTLTPEDIETLGLNAGQQIYGTELDKFINQSDIDPTLAGIAGQDEFGRYQALRQLAGDTEADLFGGVQEVGGYSPYDFNKERLLESISEKQALAEEQQRLLTGALQGISQSSMSNYLDFTPDAIQNISDIDKARQAIDQYKSGVGTELISRQARDFARSLYGGGQLSTDAQRVQQNLSEMLGRNLGADEAKWYAENVLFNEGSYDDIRRAMAGVEGRGTEGQIYQDRLAQIGSQGESEFEKWLSQNPYGTDSSGTNFLDEYGGFIPQAGVIPSIIPSDPFTSRHTTGPVSQQELKAMAGYNQALAALDALNKMQYSRTLQSVPQAANLESGGFFNVT